MEKRTLDRLMLVAGSILFSNGLLLLLGPRRFAAIRRSDRLPRQYNKTIDWLSRRGSRGRLIGALSLLIGAGLLALVEYRTDPV